MKSIFFVQLLFGIFLNTVSAQDSLLVKTRNMYVKAAQNEDMFNEFLLHLEEEEIKASPTISGYKAVGYFLKSRYSFNPFSRWKSFKKGKKLLKKAIDTAPAVVELNYLRFTIQTKAPKFLHYRSQITTDKQKLFEYLRKEQTVIDPDLRHRILTFLEASDFCSEAEQNDLKVIRQAGLAMEGI
ncbi:MAG: hypothetical protein DWQ05_17505 [Calditrichaeota bacterium]|nr:MAG: hypothetical protein DWQ05_17505 [Calditrichota bacterium]